MRRRCAVLFVAMIAVACARGDRRAQADSARAGVARAESLGGAARAVSPAGPALEAAALIVDTGSVPVLEFWPLPVTPGGQLEETRRIVEHLQADVAILRGFGGATLLASGDGTGLLVVLAWDDSAAADSATMAISGWLRANVDSAVRRRQLGTGTARVVVRRTVGTPPILGEAAMLQVTRFVMKPGHSFGALATLVDSNLATRVLQDTAAQGGATLAAADSGAVYVLLQPRNATALDSGLRVSGALPFWAPFAVRTEALMAVVASIPKR